MAVATSAKFVQPHSGAGGTGTVAPDSAMAGAQPSNLYGEGTPDGTLFPWSGVSIGSTYVDLTATAPNANTYVKRAANSVTADWNLNAGVTFVSSEKFDISAGDVTQVMFEAVSACEILEIGLIWNEATAASGALEGDITVGTTSGGGEIVAATTYDVSQATGAYQALTIADGTLAAGDSVFASHDQAAGAAGTYILQIKMRVDA